MSEEISGKSCHLGPLFWFGMELGVSVNLYKRIVHL